MIIAFPLDRDTCLSVLGRDDARLVRQSGLNVDVACLDVTGRPFVTTIPIYRLRLGKRAGAGQSARLAPSPRGEDTRPHEIADAFRRFADAMTGHEDVTPCA